jgi:abortive infection bacteriophage resistance protein
MLKPGGYFFGAVKMRYDKPPIPLDKQVSLLRERGMQVPDTARAEHYLTYIGYYRLSAYWLPFEEPASHADHGRTHRFVAHVSFDDVLNRYIFDRELRLSHRSKKMLFINLICRPLKSLMALSIT